jgi:hypothetical protein
MAIPILNHLDLRSVSELQNAILHTTTHTSATNKAGAFIYDTGSSTLKYCTGTSNSDWISLTGDTVRTVSVDTNGDGSANSTLETSETLMLKKGTNVTLTEALGVVTISSTDTQPLTTEAVQDIVAGQIYTNGSHSGISFAYDDDNDGAIDATVGTLNQDTTGTAAIATTVTVLDESNDTSCFPLFAVQATGNLAPKSGTNLTFNSLTGVLAATKISGIIQGESGSTFSSSSASEPIVHITNTHTGATAGELRFNKDSASGQDNDVMGTISFYGTDAGEATHEKLAYIDAIITDSAAGSEASSLRFYVAENDATLTQGLSIAGQADDNGEVDVTIGAGAGSTTTIAGDLVTTGTHTVNNVVTLSTTNGVQFEGAAADGHDATLLSVVAGADKTYTLPNVTGYVALFAADPSTSTITATPAELNVLDGITSTTAELNIVDGDTSATATTVVHADRVVLNDGGTMVQAAVTDLDTYFSATNKTLTNKTLTTPTIVAGGWANANHTHDASNSGGLIAFTSLSGTLQVDKGGTGATTASGARTGLGVAYATAGDVRTGTEAGKVISPLKLGGRSVVATIAASSVDSTRLRAAITHSFGTEDVIVQCYDMVTEQTVVASVDRLTKAGAASLNVVTIRFAAVPANDVRVLIYSCIGATVVTPDYTAN